MNRGASPLLLMAVLGACWPPAGCGGVDLEDIRGEPGYLDTDLGKVAVVTGDFDRIEELLSSLEVPFSLYDGFVAGPPADAVLFTRYAEPIPPVEQLLGDPNELGLFDTLFLNCGIRGTGVVDPDTLERPTTLLDDPVYADNLRTFVENGGALFVTDRSYVLLEAAFPELIDFQGDDGVPGNALAGAPGTTSAIVEDDALRQAIGTSTVEVTFENTSWAMASSAQGVWLRADVFRIVADSDLTIAPDTPILVHQGAGFGNITFTSFHNLPKVDQAWTELQVRMLDAMGGE